MPSSGATGSIPFVAADVAFRPREFTTAITNDWTTVPWCNTDFAPYDNTATDHLVTVHNPVTGVGDICRHMGVVDGSTWRIPTAAEWDELYRNGLENEGEATIPPGNGGWILGSFHPLSGYALGPNRNIVRILSDIEVSNADPYDDGAVFLSASGYRNFTNAAIFSIGVNGPCWSSAAATSTNGYNVGFTSSNVWPQQSVERSFGVSVRCIRE